MDWKKTSEEHLLTFKTWEKTVAVRSQLIWPKNKKTNIQQPASFLKKNNGQDDKTNSENNAPVLFIVLFCNGQNCDYLVLF